MIPIHRAARRHRRLVVVSARRLVLIGERIPVTAKARHADVHLAATADGRHVAAGGTVHDRATTLDERGAARRAHSQFFSQTAPGASDTASRARGNPDNRDGTRPLNSKAGRGGSEEGGSRDPPLRLGSVQGFRKSAFGILPAMTWRPSTASAT